MENNSLEIDFAPFKTPLQRWEEARDAHGNPSLEKYLEEVDPLQSHRIVAAIQHEPLSVRYLLVGASMEDLYGGPMSGKDLDSLYQGWFRKSAYESYEKVIRDRQPFYESRSFSTLFNRIGYHGIHLPFGVDRVEQTVTYIMPDHPAIKKRFHWEELIRKTPWYQQ